MSLANLEFHAGSQKEHVDDKAPLMLGLTPAGGVAPVGVSAPIAATGTLTFAANATSGDTFTIGDTVYRVMTTPAQAYDVQLGVSAEVTLDNIKAAVNASGTAGTEYFAGTLKHPRVRATTNTATTQVFEALIAGGIGNAIATTENFTNAGNVFGATTLLGGTNAGVEQGGATLRTTGTTKTRILTASSTAVAVKASAGNIYGINITNGHSAAVYVKFYDIAAASVNPASSVPVLTLVVPATSPYTLRGLDLPFVFGTAISVRAVTDAGDTGTTAPATLPIIELETV